MRFHRDLDRLRPPLAALQPDILVYETWEPLHLIQNGLNL
jgi:hypothetical protein